MMNYVCIVGYGAIGPVHIQALEKVNNAVFYAVCDNDPKKLALCEKNNKDVKLYSDFDIMLLDDKITSVHICTPHYLHFEMAKKADLPDPGIEPPSPASSALAGRLFTTRAM